MKVLVPNTAQLEIATGDTIIEYDVHEPIPAVHHDAEVIVLWQNPAWQIERCADELRSLRMVQTLASGADAALAVDFVEAAFLCSGRSLHDGPVAEHALALTLAAVRRIDVLQRSQQAHHWDDDYVRAQSDPRTASHYTLTEARVTIWGFGSIATRLAPLLAALGAEVCGVARSRGERSGFAVYAESDAGRVLATTDILISLTPASDHTVDLFREAVFDAMPYGSIFINAGRGATVDEDDLLDALRSGRLRVAAIDVMKQEPLPPESPLWSAPNLIISPHVAGNRPAGSTSLITRNLEALRHGGSLVNVVRSSSGSGR